MHQVQPILQSPRAISREMTGGKAKGRVQESKKKRRGRKQIEGDRREEEGKQ